MNINVGDMALVTVTGSLLGQRTMNTFWYRAGTVAATITDAAAFAALNTNLQVNFLPLYRACVPTNWQGWQVWYQVIKPTRGRKYVHGFNVTGEGLSDALTANVQGSITRFGDAATRDAVGGVRIPIGTGPDVINSGLLTPEQTTAMEEFAAEMEVVRTAGTPAVEWVPMVGLPANPINWLRVQSTTVQPTVRVLRRRTVGVGI